MLAPYHGFLAVVRGEPLRLTALGFLSDALCKRRNSHRPEIPVAAMPNRHAVRLGFTSTHDGHVRDLLQLRIADLRLHLLLALIQPRADATAAQLPGDLPCVLQKL